MVFADRYFMPDICCLTEMQSLLSPNLAARETCVAETNFAARKQKMFLPGVKNIFASRTQILRPKHKSFILCVS